MKLVIPYLELDKVRKGLNDFSELDLLEENSFSENYELNINFTQSSYYIKSTTRHPVFEDKFFLELILNHLKEKSEFK